MLRSFRLKIAFMTLCLSGLMLLAFGFFAVSALNRVAIERIDRELIALADTQVRREQPRDHWHRFDASFRSMYGMDESKQFIVKATLHQGEVLHTTADWPAGLSQNALPLPIDAVPFTSREKASPARQEAFNSNRIPAPREMTVRGPVFATLIGAGNSWRAITMANEEVSLSIAINLAGLHVETSRFRNTLFIGAPLGLLLLATGGWLIGHLALRPIDRIAKTAEQMTAQQLDARIHDKNADKELQRLIDVINGMLERLDMSFHQATRFSADAAHELKTPLAILQAQLERSLQRADDESLEQREYAEQLDEVQRLKIILQKLLLLSRADAGQLPLSADDLNLAELARGAATDIEILAPDRTVTVDAPTELMARGDAHLINQILENLISNTIKFGEENGWITIKVTEQKGSAIVTVANNGTAIPEQDQEKIFERFYRGDPSRSRQTEGAGLGLSLARELARAHGGDITLEQSNGNLTCFALALPRHGRS
ncbi:MAG: HAMP domain-containing protein [Kiritimatiellales bacterium]|nr:HAMP domain-containing protein [Kiritimatiellales bacterium]